MRWARSRDAQEGDGWPSPERERDVLAVAWPLGLLSDALCSSSRRPVVRVRMDVHFKTREADSQDLPYLSHVAERDARAERLALRWDP